MVYVFLLIMEARVYVILKFSSISCYLNIIMSCTDGDHWPDHVLMEIIGQTLIRFLYVIQELSLQSF